MNARKLALFMILAAGCSAGAASGTGTSAEAPQDAGGTTTKKDAGGGTLIEDQDAGTTPRKDGGVADTGTEEDATTSVSDAAPVGRDAAKPVDAAPVVDAANDTGVAGNDAVADAQVDAGPVCSIDDATWVRNTGAVTVNEYDIVAKGKIWAVSAAGVLLGSVSLNPAAGPCAGQVGTCRLEATTWREDLGEYHIAQGGTLWRLDIDGNILGSLSLQTFTGLVGAGGPCEGKAATACTFEAGAYRSDLGQYHLIADGKIWAVNGTSPYALVGSQSLTSLTAVANGPCAGQAGTCHVDAFTYRPDTDEVHVVAKGNLYIMNDTGSILKSTTSLLSIPGMAQGPCK